MKTIKRHPRLAWLVMGLLCISGIAFASIYGDLRRVGLDVDRGDLTVSDGKIVVNGTARTEGYAFTSAAFETYNTTTTAKTVLAAQCYGTVFVVTESSDDPVTFNLPTAVKGMVVTFIDLDSTAAADLTVNPADADQINGDTAGDAISCTSDVIGETVTLVCYAAGQWTYLHKHGTWTAA